MKVFIVSWTEYEKGWGSRPDGTSYHISEEKRDEYIKVREKDAANDKFHDIYPDGFSTVEDSDLYKKVLAAGGSLG